MISYTRNWVYVCFAAVGSWLGAYAFGDVPATIAWRRRRGARAPLSWATEYLKNLWPAFPGATYSLLTAFDFWH